jgi:hypothetical protein
MPDLIAYVLSSLLILLSGVGIVATFTTRTKKRWADVTRRV